MIIFPSLNLLHLPAPDGLDDLHALGLDLHTAGNDRVLGHQLDLVGVEPDQRPVLAQLDAPP
jgi:hypothetical protein